MRDELGPKTARCCCGNLSITVQGRPKMHGVCHCDNCKRRTGSAFGLSLYFKKTDLVALHGERNEYAFVHQARQHKQQRYFCVQCGSTLFWYVSDMPDLIGIAGGCFADRDAGAMASLGEPSYVVDRENACAWLGLSPSIKPV